ncbi:xylulokinase [Oculatella sp. LEGE 06141]|uniref:xylulokinase n=1 Tax=Oculatella sp. LEGE 06141 TaxID=1828648 RepID=UPI001880A1D9|nr:xylulokinase [Oculatella sp. LEGE 06141]MBE9180282.1 xylulokinase [Oculatella sp. LEGE 06141]
MLLGIDLGTGSAKALLLSLEGDIVGEASSPYPVRSPQPGWAETEPQDWWSAVAIAVQTAVQHHTDAVEAIGLSGQMHGVVLTNAAGIPLRPAILWADTRSSDRLTAYHGLESRYQQQLANPITAGMAGSTLLWLRQHEPEFYQQARWVLQPKDWLRLQMTGAVAADPSDASGTLLYDVIGDRWAVELLQRLTLRSDWLPELRPSSQIAGQLTAEAAEQLGLPAGLPVVTGAADTAAALLGSGLVAPGVVQLTVGSGAQIVTPRSHPVPDLHGKTHLYRAALPRQWYTLAAIQNAGLALEWVRTILGLSWAQVYAEAFAVAPGCEGLTFLPYLTGERTPHLDPYARGAWVGLGLHHTRAHLMRAALEGVAFSLRQGLEAIVATGITPTQLRLAGGGTLEPVWRQLLADVLQVPLHSVAIASASARGAAILAGMGIGKMTLPQEAAPLSMTQPEPLPVELKEAWQRFCTLYPQLRQWADDTRQLPVLPP